MSEQTPEVQIPQPENKSGSKRILYILLVLILLGINGFLVYNLMKTKEEKKEVVEENTVLKDNLKKAADDLKAAKMEIEELRKKGEISDSLANVYKAQIADYEEQLAKYKNSAGLSSKQIKELKATIADMNDDIDGWKAQIDSLIQVNKTLYSEKEIVEQNLEQEQQVTKKLTDENEQLEHKVELGSLLKTINLYGGAVKYKGGNKEVKTTNAKKAEKLKVCFDTGDNQVIEKGEDVTFLLRIIGPDGATIAIQSQGSGYFNLADTGEEKQYTVKKTVSFNQKSQQVCIYWQQSTAYAEGDYSILIYQSGYLIGETNFELKDGFF